MKLRILIGCEFSGTVRDAFRALGQDAWSCDLFPCEGNNEFHIVGDVLDIAYNQPWDVFICHPPCTYLCNSGVRWLTGQDGKAIDMDRWKAMYDGCSFFLRCLKAPIKHICLENPIQHKHAKEIINVEPTQTIQPHEFGHPETKATCLWLDGLPLLVPTSRWAGAEARVHKAPPSPDRWKERSRTYPGIAKAMASQWCQFLSRFYK